MTYVQRIRELDRTYTAQPHITTKYGIETVRETLELERMTEEELRNMRDMVVMYYTVISTSARAEKEYGKMGRAQENLMSITAVIDMELWQKGCEV